MEDGFLCVEGLAVAVGGHAWVEEACEGVLAEWTEVVLALDHDQAVCVEGSANSVEVGRANVFQVGIAYFCSKGFAWDRMDCDC